jgi:hypothetical protein
MWLVDRRTLRLQLSGSGGTQELHAVPRWASSAEVTAMLLASGFALELYAVFAMLSNLGFIVRTLRPLPPGATPHEAATGVCPPLALGPGRAQLLVYRPNQAFRRSEPGPADFAISVSVVPQVCTIIYRHTASPLPMIGCQ